MGEESSCSVVGRQGGAASEEGLDSSSWLSSSSSSSSSSRSESESESSRSENWCSSAASEPSCPSEPWKRSSLVPRGEQGDSRLQLLQLKSIVTACQLGRVPHGRRPSDKEDRGILCK